MKTIGLIGGMSWESTVTYYEKINELVNHSLGGLHSAKIVLTSVDFSIIEECQKNNEWERSADILTQEALKLEKIGVDFILICTNTMHKNFDQIQARIAIPILHIAEATIEKLQEENISHVGLLGTKYTMEQDFYKKRIIDANIQVLIPQPKEIEVVNDVIFDELVFGEIKPKSKDMYLDIINHLIDRGAEGIILGCTEIGLLIKQEDVTIPIFDTTLIHSEKAVERALN